MGLSIASAVAARWPEKTTYLVERNKSFGEETSSRNSEVIHAGLYYPADSLKTRLCLRGRELIYQRCQQHSVPHKQTKKLVVGADFSKAYLEKLQSHCDALGPLAPPTRLLTGQQARKLEPNLSDNIAWALLSERTGIVSSHELMASLERDLFDADNAEIVYDTKVVRVDPNHPDRNAVNSKRGSDGSQDGWIVQTLTSDDGSASASDADALLAKVVINASGLNAPMVLNSLLSDLGGPSNDAIPMWHSKGNYASYKGRGADGIQHLIYPCPDTRNKGTHAHTSLGTHLTLDLDGNVRFGPDTEWISPPSSEDAIDFWKRSLVVDDARIESMYASITEYLPNIDKNGLAPDYAGIRPKLIGPDTRAFMDFQFLWHNSTNLTAQRLWQRAPGLPAPSTSCISPAKESVDRVEGGAMISLLGIESPGLTSCLAIGELVREMIATRFYSEHPTRQASPNKGARNEDHAHRLDAWA